MSEFIHTLYDRAHEAQNKFDYFLCAAAGALFAYLAQNYAPEKIDNLFAVIQLLSLLILAASFYSGIKRIQIASATSRLNLQAHMAQDTCVHMTRELSRNEKVYRNETTNVIISREAMEQLHQASLNAMNALNSQIEARRIIAVHYGMAQLWLLFAAFVLILFGKVLQPYQLDFSSRFAPTAHATGIQAPEILNSSQPPRTPVQASRSEKLKIMNNGVEVHTLMLDQYNALIGYLENEGQTNALDLFRQYRCAYGADSSSSDLGDTLAILKYLHQGNQEQSISLLEQRLCRYSGLTINCYGGLYPTNRDRVNLEPLKQARDYFEKYPSPSWDLDKAVNQVLREAFRP